MENFSFDTGMKEYRMDNGKVLRFNPSDPNVYANFMDAIPVLEGIEADMMAKGRSLAAEDVAGALNVMREADKDIKRELGKVFTENDFEDILDGVNLMAVASNGQRVISNFRDVMTPIFEDGVKRFTDNAISEAAANREQRRAAQRGQQ